MNLPDIEKIAKEAKAAGRSRIELPINVVQNLVNDARKAQGVFSLAEEAARFKLRAIR